MYAIIKIGDFKYFNMPRRYGQLLTLRLVLLLLLL